jgi:hypothetical protein
VKHELLYALQEKPCDMTDEMAFYVGLEKEFGSHGSVNHSAEEYVRGIIHVNFSESYFALLKRGIIGTFHHVSAKHMQRYLEEFDFRWNRRKTGRGGGNRHEQARKAPGG